MLKLHFTAVLLFLNITFLSAQVNTGIVFSGAFGGTTIETNTYTNPTGAEGWAGFANEDFSLYPLSFSDDGELSFTGSTVGIGDAEVYFRFEYNPYPDTEPSFSTETVTISGSIEETYVVNIPTQGVNIYSSFLFYVITKDVPVTLTNVSVTSSAIIDPCADVICPDGQECIDGECIFIPFSGPSIGAPTPPSRDPFNVISIYSDAYANVNIDNFDFGLCGSSSAVAEEMIDGNSTQHYLGEGCQGISVENNRIDASSFTNLHFDFFTDETNLIGKVFNIKLVDWAGNATEAGASGLEINFNDGSNPAIISDSWVSVDVDITSLGALIAGNLTISDIAQIHITSNLSNAWYDNLYLYKEAFLPVDCDDGVMNQDETGLDCGGENCEPCSGPPSVAAPTPPSRDPSNVISIYSDAYANVNIDNFDFGLCGSSSAVVEEMIDGNSTQHYLGLGCQGISIEDNRIDASSFTNLHFDFFTDETNLIGKVFNIKLVDWAGNATEAGASGLEINFNDGTNPAIISGSWVSVDVNLTSIGLLVGGNLTRSDIAQIHITSNLSNAWYDNLYLHKEGLSVLENHKYIMKVFPNPSKDHITVYSQLLLGSNIEIKVHDLVGKLVRIISVKVSLKDSIVLDVSTLTTGSYIISLSDGIINLNNRLVIQ